jgi:hypothetical protein
MDSFEQLSRTRLLLETDFGIADPAIIMRALFQPCILLVADQSIISTLAGQVAVSTAAMQCIRSGHCVYIDAPDTPTIGYQPPMSGRSFHEAIESVADQLIDGVSIKIGRPLVPADIAFVFGGNAAAMIPARRVVSVGCTNWSGSICDVPRKARWTATKWPMGALVAATLVAAEAFKITGRILLPLSDRAGEFAPSFAPLHEAEFRLCSEETPLCADIGNVDLVSAGAITNSVLYALLRVPGIAGKGRAFDRDTSDHSNRNRNALLLRQGVGHTKVDLFASLSRGFEIEPIYRHFENSDIGDIADRVIVGVDDIPTRWLLASAGVGWMGVGATTHFKAMSSVHYPLSGCAACLHPHDEPQNGPIPTVAFSSFLAGLMVAAELLSDVGGSYMFASRQAFVEALYPATIHRMKVPAIFDCPGQCDASQIKIAG